MKVIYNQHQKLNALFNNNAFNLFIIINFCHKNYKSNNKLLFLLYITVIIINNKSSI